MDRTTRSASPVRLGLWAGGQWENDFPVRLYPWVRAETDTAQLKTIVVDPRRGFGHRWRRPLLVRHLESHRRRPEVRAEGRIVW
jgi:hypothetical protein